MTNKNSNKESVNITNYRREYTESQRRGVKTWLTDILNELKISDQTIEYQASIQKMSDLINRDAVVRMYLTKMLEQSHGNTRFDTEDESGLITTIDTLLLVMNYIVTRAPNFVYDEKNPDLTGAYTFPLSSLFTEMMATEAGESAFRNAAFNNALTEVLQAWCDYLDSDASTSVLNHEKNGWLSAQGQEYTELYKFVTEPGHPHLGFTSYNDFFHRKIKEELRPIASPADPKVIASPNDGTVYKIASNIEKSTDFWAKGQTYSLANILNNDADYVNHFTGGNMVQTFLSGNDYHRFHSPIDGTVEKVEVVQGLTFSQRSSEKEPGAGTESLGYEAAVNTRGLLYIRSNDKTLGTVCIIPIGITEISSVRFGDHIKPGYQVTKGEEVGHFSYGGSTLCLLFQPGAIKNFVVEPTESQSGAQAGSVVKVNAQIATAN
ncbi:phosphatidylserine decarboxylase family protein [Shewanella sp.]|uniref:phosphatidylserine decarboxylase family protein n=1 Tax=Shewanella sp. TaxID=50422 RepID=UPI001EB8609C|nr:phosphatidylserine decarboxylase family protein [Shewanella sp.]NRB25573.1 phophatidylserine decarboxylase associated domain-containing protein [Shewanella sp.]